MEKMEEKMVLVFRDEIAKILLCDLESKLDNFMTSQPPCVYVCDSGKTYYGGLTPKQVDFFQSENPENFSIWLERPDGETFECVSKPSEPGFLEDQFKSELLQRFKAYAAALQELGVKEFEIRADEKAIETYEEEDDLDAEASGDAPIARGKGKYHSENGGTSEFIQEIQKSVKVKFNKAKIVDCESLKPQLERDGFWTDEVVQAIVRARKQGRELEQMEMKISAIVSSNISSKFKMAAGLEAEVKTWQISGSVDVNESVDIKALSSLAQNLSVIISTGFSSVDGKAKRKGRSVIEDAEDVEAVDVEEPEVEQIAEVAVSPKEVAASPEKEQSEMPKCPSCGAAISAKAKFCSECGAPLARKCASCGTELKPSMKYCPECGAKV